MADLRVSFPKPCNAAWEEMAQHGCDRRCAMCDTVVHDLSRLSFDEAVALLDDAPGACVRARIDADGVVELRQDGRNAARILAAMGASIGLLAAGAPASAQRHRPSGAISGQVATPDWNTRVTATRTDGVSRRGKVKGDGKYRLRHLLPGVYRLTFVPSCGDPWTVEHVVVGDTEVIANTADDNSCIIVGMIQVDRHEG